MANIDLNFPDTTYTSASKPVTTTLSGDLNTIESWINTHDAASAGIHGVTGSVLGTTDTQTASNKTFTNPVISQINDANGNETVKMVATASAVNEVAITNNITAVPPRIAATGGDTNIHLDLRGKANGLVKVSTLRQDNITNTYKPNTVVASGWGFMTSAGARTYSEAVTFGITFDAAPIVTVAMAGRKVGSNPTAINDCAHATIGVANCGAISTTGFTAGIIAHDFAGTPQVFTSGDRILYSWIAIGQLT